MDFLSELMTRLMGECRGHRSHGFVGSMYIRIHRYVLGLYHMQTRPFRDPHTHEGMKVGRHRDTYMGCMSVPLNIDACDDSVKDMATHCCLLRGTGKHR